MIKLLLLLLLLVSCGKETPIFGSLMEQWAENKNKKTYEELVGSKLRLCGERYYNYSCTNTMPVPRLLQPYEFFSHHCYNGYLQCLESNNARP